MRPVIRNLAAVACVGALLTACSSGTPDATTSQDASANPDEKITLTVATFNEFGYEELIKEYMAENPNITVEQRKAATANEARDNMNTRLAAGSGLADVEAIEIDWLTELMQYPDKFVDLADPELEGRWLDWKTAAVTTEDGKLIGYGTDIGPQGICYRADLMEKAGFPTDREEVAALLEGDWDNYFSVGKDYVAKSGGVAWLDSASATFQGMVNHVENPFENSDGTPIPLSENGSTTRSPPLPSTMACPPAWRSGPRTGPTPSRVRSSPPCSAPAGCWASSRATPRASRAGTSPTSTRAAAATGAAPT